MDESGKKRSVAQRVGTSGEIGFRDFAHRQGLIASKCEDDFGIDFFCHVDLNHKSSSASSVADTIVLAFVRASTTSSGRITLSRADAQNLLRARGCIFVALVHDLKSGRLVYHRFVDASFARELSAFLAGQNESLSLVPSDCAEEPSFGDALKQATRLGARESIELALAEDGLGQHLTDAEIEVVQTSTGALTLVTTLNFYDYFDALDAEDQARLYEATFGVAERQQERLAALALKTGVTSSLSRLPQPLFLGGFVTHAAETLSMREQAAEHLVDCTFSYTSNKDHFGWVHPAGLSLTVSRRRLVDGQYVHETEVFLDPDVATDLEDLGDLRPFLEAGTTGASLVGRDGFEMEIEYFAPLLRVGEMQRHHRLAATLQGWRQGVIQLRDAEDLESAVAMGFLAKLASGEEMAPIDFVLETPDSDPSAPLGGLVSREADFRLPIIVNTRHAGIVALLNVNGKLHETPDGESLRGLRIEHVANVELKVVPRFVKSTIYPEILIDPTWPTLPLGGPAPEDDGSTAMGVYPAESGGWGLEFETEH